MKIVLATISPRRNASGPASELLKVFVERIVFYVTCEHRTFASEAQLVTFLETSAGRTRPYLIVTDSRGKQLSSEEMAVRLSSVIDGGTQLLVLAIGPADGWSATTLNQASETWAFGRITLPHELAAVIAAEQTYRALTIRAGHPYHGGH